MGVLLTALGMDTTLTSLCADTMGAARGDEKGDVSSGESDGTLESAGAGGGWG